MFALGQGNGSQGLTTKLHTRDLDHDRDYQDKNEERVVEEILEDVDLSLLKFPGVDLVEHLHQDEGVEEDAVMSSVFIVPVRRTHTDRGLNTEELRT